MASKTIEEVFSQGVFGEAGELKDFTPEQRKKGWASIGKELPESTQFTQLQNDCDRKDAWLYNQLAEVIRSKNPGFAPSEEAKDDLLKALEAIAALPTATEKAMGIAQLATKLQAEALTEDGAVFMSPLKVGQALDAKVADQTDIQNGTAGKLVDAAGLRASTKTPRINIVKFEQSGTYTPSAGTQYIVVEGVGGGGAGGGCTVTKAYDTSIGSGGGAGGYCKSLLKLSEIGSAVSVTIGAGGVGVSATVGGAGGATSFGAFFTASGGGGGSKAGPAAASFKATGAIGGSASGANILNIRGARGGDAFTVEPSFTFAGDGGNSQLGCGGIRGEGLGAAVNATEYGSGGGGSSVAGGSTGAHKGGKGAAGVVIITEYILE